MATTSNMFLYSLTIQPPTNVVQAVLGQFGGSREQLIVTASGSRLTLLRPDANLGKVHTVLSHDVFGIIRSLAPFRTPSTHFIIVSSDSGRITIVEYLPEENRFARVHMETYGKSGVRRVVPGEYLVCDPKGRAFLVASIEKNKLVYILNRVSGAVNPDGNLAAELTISSPLEAHKPRVLVLSMVALDVGYSNPVFAALEINCSALDPDATEEALDEVQTQLVYYELDLGLNYVVRKWSEPVDPTASMLFQVPGGNDGPSGVLVCGEESITYMHSNQEPLRIAIPRRRGATEDPKRKRSIVSGIMHKLKGSSGAYFFLLQTEDGDLFRVTMDMIKDDSGKATGEVRRLTIKYFDTVPVATSFCILKSGFLYVASQHGNPCFYQFEKLGDDDNELEFSSDDFPVDPQAPYEPVYFHPRLAENITMFQSIPAMNPLMDCKVANLTGEDAPQIYTICGNGARSSFRMLRHGLDVTEIVGSELPGAPVAVWTLKLHRDDQYDAYIVLSFGNGSLILSIGETVEEVSDSGFLTTVPTLAAQLLGDNSLLQVHPKGIRVVRNGQASDWEVPQHRSIVAAATNSKQVAVALSSGEIIYFEADEEGNLNEFEERKAMSGTVTALSLGDVPEGRIRSSFLAVGCDDCTVRILSLDAGSTLESKSVQALTAAPTSLAIITMDDSSSGGSTLYLHIGLYSGVYLRTVIDEVSGELTDTRQKFLGPKPVKLFQLTVEGKTCVLALSSRPWLGYPDPITKSFVMTPLNFPELQWGWNFQSEQCEEGLVTIHGQALSILSIERLGDTISQKAVPLTYTPRKLIKHPDQPIFYTIEADNNTLSPDLREKLLADPAAVNGDAAVLPPTDFGYPKGNRRWASCISVIDPISDDEPQVLQTIELQDNESFVSAAIVPFASQDGENFLVVGTGKNIVVNPRSFSEAHINIYRLGNEGREVEFVHRTAVEDLPMALLPFQGKVLAGIGKTLRMYDLGMRQLLRKAQAEAAPQQIVSLNTQGNRIVVGDVQQGITYVAYKPASNKLIPFADDTVARWTTSTAMVDYESVAGGDKFGNIFIVRCPSKASAEADEEDTGVHLLNARGYLHGTANRLDLMCHFFTQDIPTSVAKTSLVVGGQEVLLWSGIMGTIGVFIPLISREDADFFQSLEQHLRTEDPPLLGRDHLMYRGYYAPVKGVIDGDLCERYTLLPNDKKMMIAGELDRSVREIERKISVLRLQLPHP
ncbi:splicing factor 3B subunit 3 [Purpureocillium lavendulum]|uniref:Pre-mRNA-splicing factor RSE1 n=1 Tax=Purpureocillium lavendulum TaxID=1247861 RepID=A0AB34G8P8_9HYPO|nr:splicing factor 3B subunit 3 [Purpureocillium lavendulum]